jgi:hypothetical protein
MALIAVGSAKGAPGATTVALTLAAVWPRRAVLAELDPTGSDLLYRLRAADRAALDPDRGVLGYLTGGDVESGGDPLPYTQQVGAGLDLLVGPPPARVDEVAGSWGLLADRLAAADVDTVADCGRLHPGSPALEVLARCAAAVLVTRPTIDGVAHLLARAAEVAEVVPAGAGLYAVVVTDVRDARSQREIDQLADRADLPLEVLGRLADDPEAVGLLGGAWSGRLEKSLLVRSARDLAGKLDKALDGAPL